MKQLPLLFLFLCGMGNLSPVMTASVPIRDGMGPLLSSGRDLATVINDNSRALAHLSTLTKDLIDFMSLNPCTDSHVTNNVSDVMAEGFTTVMETMREVHRIIPLLKLTKWRINFVKSLNIPKMDQERSCPVPFFMLDDECIYIDTTVRRSFRDSEITCFFMGGHLAEPANLESFANNVYKLNGEKSTEVYIGGLMASNNTFVWTTNSQEITGIPWDTSDRDDSPGCMVAKQEKYRKIACTYRRHFACEIDL